MKGHTVWLTGLSGSGKSAIAQELVKYLNTKRPTVLVDGDEVRKWISYDLGYTKYARDKNITRIAGLCYILTASKLLSVVGVVSPTKRIRNYARSLIKNFTEIYVNCPLEVCEQRDVKGFYKQARKGEIDFVGINIPYEKPDRPELELFTDKEGVSRSVARVVCYLEEKGVI